MKQGMNQIAGCYGIILLGGLMALVATSVRATEVYRWVDDDGVTHFSQTAPETAVHNVEREVIENPVPSGYDPEQDIYDVAGQRERMQALRESMERDREARLERERRATQAPVRNDQPVQSYPAYGWPAYRPRPPHRPQPPVEPPVEPPVQPIRPPSTLQPPRAGRQ